MFCAHSMRVAATGLALLVASPVVASSAWADGLLSDNPFGSGKLLMTGGISTIEGAGGGALAAWALTSGYGTDTQIGGSAFATYVGTGDYHLSVFGAAISFLDRLELSYARQTFDTGETGKVLATLVPGADEDAKLDVWGAKLRLFGDAVYNQDRWLPQVAIGVEYKKNQSDDLMAVLGAATGGKVDDDGFDYYIAATKVFLEPGILVNGTLRLTKANQFGLLGFGGDKHDSYSPQFEGTLGYLLTRHVAIGGEYRFKPSNIDSSGGPFAGALARPLEEDNAFDLWLAYFPLKHVSLTVAYVNLGNIASVADFLGTASQDRTQQGFYSSLQLSF